MLHTLIPIFLLVAGIALSISLINADKKSLDLFPLIIGLVVGSVFLTFSLRRIIKRQQVQFESYSLTVADHVIGREIANTPTILIYTNDIREIIKRRNGSFVIVGKKAGEMIFIPQQIEDYEELETRLNNLKPLNTSSSVRAIQWLQIGMPLVGLGLMVATFYSFNKIIVGVCGSLLIGLLLWGFVALQKSKHLDDRTKRTKWWMLFLTVVVIAVMFMKLSLFASYSSE